MLIRLQKEQSNRSGTETQSLDFSVNPNAEVSKRAFHSVASFFQYYDTNYPCSPSSI